MIVKKVWACHFDDDGSPRVWCTVCPPKNINDYFGCCLTSEVKPITITITDGHGEGK